MDVGDVSEERTDYCWKIPDFFSRTEDETARIIFSSPFSSSGFFSGLALSTIDLRQGREMKLGVLMAGAGLDGKKLCFTVGVEKSGGTVEGAETLTHIFKKDEEGVSLRLKDLNLRVLQERRSELVPAGTLTVTCCVETDGRSGSKMVSSQTSQTSEVDASSPDDVSTQPSEVAGAAGLARDLKALLLSGDNSDATVRVEEQEFRVHKLILAARTPVFSAMFKHETKERATGVLDIEDSDPDTVRRFLQFIYTGRIDDLTADNAAGVYEMADKYQLLELKEECLECIKRGLSVKSFCHVITLALKHEEKELITLATDFFVQNATEIVRTVEWQVFMSENPTQANELVIKGFEKR